MNNIYYGKLVFELSKPGRTGYSLPENPWEHTCDIPVHLKQEKKVTLPEVDEPTVVLHYTNMSNNNFGVDTGF